MDSIDPTRCLEVGYEYQKGVMVLLMLAACSTVFAFGTKEAYQGEDPAELTVELSADGRSVATMPEGYEAAALMVLRS